MSNENALKEFIIANSEVVTLLQTLMEKAENHYGYSFEDVNYANVGSVLHLVKLLEEANTFIGK